MKLENGMIVSLSERRKGGYKYIGTYCVEDVSDKAVRLRRQSSGYIETVSIIDLKQQRYRLVLEDGRQVLFKPMKNVLKEENEQRSKDLEGYRHKGAGRSSYLWKKDKEADEDIKGVKFDEIKDEGLKEKVVELIESEGGEAMGDERIRATKKNILRMCEEGKSIDEIVEEIRPGWDGKLSLLKAKIELYVNGPKEGERKRGTAKKEAEPESRQEEKVGAGKKSSLRAKILVSENTGFEYEMERGDVKIKGIAQDNGACFFEWDTVGSLIEELQELQRMHTQQTSEAAG